MKSRNENRQVEEELYERRADICRVFANPVRLKILHLLAKRVRPVFELHQRLGISEANLCQHLAVLKGAGVITTHRTGKRVDCYLVIPEVKQLSAAISNVVGAQVKRLQCLGA